MSALSSMRKNGRGLSPGWGNAVCRSEILIFSFPKGPAITSQFFTISKKINKLKPDRKINFKWTNQFQFLY